MRHATRSVRRLMIAGALVAAGTVGPSATVAVAASNSSDLTCHGLPVTVAEHGGVVHGTPGNDVIRLTRPGTVYGGRGRDIICGSTGRDQIYPGGGNDIVLAGAGADVVRGGAGRDNIFGEAGGDRIWGGPHSDTIVSGAGRDLVVRDAEARRGQSATATGGRPDNVSFNRQAISILVNNASLDTLLESGTRFAVSRPQNGQASADPGVATPVWVAFEPFTKNVVTWPDDDYEVFGSTAPIVEGARVVPETQAAAGPGSALRLNANQTWTSVGGGPRGTVSVTNASAERLGVGLAQVWQVNGQSGSGPLGVVPLEPSQTVSLAPPTTVSLVAAPNVESGVIAEEQQAAAIATLSPGQPTATFFWSDETGGFIEGNPPL